MLIFAGSNVRMRVFQSLSYGLHHDKRHLEQRHLASVNSLEFGTALGSAAILVGFPRQIRIPLTRNRIAK